MSNNNNQNGDLKQRSDSGSEDRQNSTQTNSTEGRRSVYVPPSLRSRGGGDSSSRQDRSFNDSRSELKNSRDSRDSRDPPRDSRDSRDSRDPPRDSRDSRDARDPPRDYRDARDPPRDFRTESRDSRDPPRDFRDSDARRDDRSFDRGSRSSGFGGSREDFPRRGGGGGGWGSSGDGRRGGWGGSSGGGSSYGRYEREEPNPFAETRQNEEVQQVEAIQFDNYDDIPVETSGRDCPKNIESWDDTKLHPTIEENIKLCKYAKPTPIQKYSLPIVGENRDLMGCAQTGSGKTAAFLIPIVEKILREEPAQTIQNHGGRKKIYPTALILAPVRELACQIHEKAKQICYKTGLKAAVVYGGDPIVQQLRELERGCDILIATPGRLVDMIERAKISLSGVRFLVLDEADRMLDMGFEPQIIRIVEEEDMPRAGDRQTLMFSATFPKEMQKLAATFLYDYVFLAVGTVGSTTDNVTQKFLRAQEGDKDGMLLDLIASVKGLTVIFVETKRKADQLEDFLQREGFPATSIHGDRDQADRSMALRTFTSGKTPYLVATSVAARGLDIPNVSHVINYDMPNDPSDYVHRIGRTGRAGKPGLATALISDDNIAIVPKLLELLHGSNQEIPPWLESMRSYNKSYGGGGNRRGPKFGGRDYRSERSHGGGGRDDPRDRSSGGGHRNDSWGDQNYSGGGSGGSNWF